MPEMSSSGQVKADADLGHLPQVPDMPQAQDTLRRGEARVLDLLQERTSMPRLQRHPRAAPEEGTWAGRRDERPTKTIGAT